MVIMMILFQFNEVGFFEEGYFGIVVRQKLLMFLVIAPDFAAIQL